MGQFLALGLTHEISVDVADMRKKKVSTEELCQQIERSYSIGIDLYDVEETDNRLLFALNQDIIKNGLLPFLEALYPTIYQRHNQEEMDGVANLLKKLRSMPSTDWINEARHKSHCAFQIDSYSDILQVFKDFRPRIQLTFGLVILKLGYGKVITEGIGDFERFFNCCIHETFKEHSIVKAVQVYITE